MCNYFNNSSIGCFVEVDLECPDELDDLHNGYPLSGEKNKINRRKFVRILITNHRR